MIRMICDVWLKIMNVDSSILVCPWSDFAFDKQRSNVWVI